MKGYVSRAVIAWSLYDFANSAFATTILSVIFNVYFVKVICRDGARFLGRTIPGESFWGYAMAVSGIAILFLGPLMGAAADFSASKKKYLAIFWSLGWFFTGLLFFCKEGDYWIAAVFFILANIGFNNGNGFYNAFLNDISTPANVGRVSGFGWALGYIGGGLLLALNLVMIRHPEWFGMTPQNHLPVRASFLSVSIWWLVFSIPLFLWVEEKKSAWPAPARTDVYLQAFRDVIQTLKEIRRHKEIFKFMAAYIIYNDGIETVIIMASIFGAKELGLSQDDLILCFLMIQAVAFVGALAFGELSDRFTHKACIAATLLIYVAVCVWGIFMRTQSEFWMLGAVVGLILGGSQSASRALLAVLTPPEHSAKFFGFFALAGKMSTVFGPLVFAVVSQVYSLRAAIGSLSFFFVVGLFLLYFVREPALQKIQIS